MAQHQEHLFRLKIIKINKLMIALTALSSTIPRDDDDEYKSNEGERGEDGGRVRCRDHPPPHRYIRNTSTRGTAPIEHPLNAGRRPQTSQKQETPHVPG